MPSTSGSNASFALDSAYTHLTSGDAVAMRVVSPYAGEIQRVYFFVHSTAGTRGSIAMRCTIYNEGSNTARPGSTSRATTTTLTYPGSDLAWGYFDFGTPYSTDKNEVVWILIENVAASPTVDYPTIRTSASGGLPVLNQFYSYTSTTGFSTNGTAAIKMPMVVRFGASDYFFGNPVTQYGTKFASNTLRRGMKFTAAAPATIGGVMMLAASQYSGFELYAGSTAPGGSAVVSVALDSTADATTLDAIGAAYFDDYNLTVGQTYRAVFTMGSSNTSPAGFQVEDHAAHSTAMNAILLADNNAIGTIDDGAGGWTDYEDFMPAMALIVTGYQTSSSGNFNPFLGLVR